MTDLALSQSASGTIWANFLHMRIPAEPFPSPIKEPPDGPENPDAPVREPDPDEPGQM
jgi:hypothetical protein